VEEKAKIYVKNENINGKQLRISEKCEKRRIYERKQRNIK
jgi:hypothetical protein